MEVPNLNPNAWVFAYSQGLAPLEFRCVPCNFPLMALDVGVLRLRKASSIHLLCPKCEVLQEFDLYLMLNKKRREEIDGN